MLVLTRRDNEVIRIGNDIFLCFQVTGPHSVRVGIDAPKEINIVREELLTGNKKMDKPRFLNRKNKAGNRR